MAQPKSRPEPDSKYCGGTLSDLCIKKCLQMSINWSTIIKKGGPKFVQNDVKHWFSHKETVKFMLIPLKVQASELWGELSFSQNCTEPYENVLFQLCADHSQRKSNSFNLKYKKTCVCTFCSIEAKLYAMSRDEITVNWLSHTVHSIPLERTHLDVEAASVHIIKSTHTHILFSQLTGCPLAFPTSFFSFFLISAILPAGRVLVHASLHINALSVCVSAKLKWMDC